MGFSETLKQENQDLWGAILAHPYVKELGSATLPKEKFTFYVKQDYPYLIDFGRCIGLAATKAEGIKEIQAWGQRMNGILQETAMLENLSAKLGIAPEDIRYAEKQPTCEAYVNHLLKVAYIGTLGENVAAMLPCMWTYMDVGHVLVDIGGYKGHHLYEEWCNAYAAPGYVDLVQSYIDVVDEIAENSGESMRNKMRQHFKLSMRYEYMFWDMAYNMEKWVV